MRTGVGIRGSALAALMLALAAVPIVLTWREPPLAPLTGVAPEFADRVIPGELVVDLRDDASPGEIAALAARYGLTLRDNSPVSRAARLMEATLAPEQDAADLAARLSRERIVEAAAPAREAFAFWKPNDPRYREQWNMRLIGMERAWEISRGRGVVVAVIDTGVACEQDEKCTLARDFKGVRVARGYDFVHNDQHPTDDAGHGTHVAGTIAETTNNGEGVAGIAFEATIMPLKVLSAHGTGTSADIAAAIRYAADHGARIINMSLGMPFPDPIVRAACRYANRKGVTIVCAAGNGGTEGVFYPAAFPECIAVSAVGPDDTLTPYSSYGPQIALAAPGGFKGLGESGGILQNTLMPDGTSLRDDYYYFQGTSMASPHVAGVAALVMARGVTDPAQVRALLKQSAKRKGSPEKYGAGRLDAAAAVAGAAALSGETALKLGLSLPAILPLGVLALRRRRGAAAAWPVALAAAILAGWLGPDALVARIGFASPWHLLGHSALLPALCLTEAGSRRGLRLTALFAGAMTLHLLWDLLRGTAPQATGLAASGDWQMALWLAVNAVVGAGITLAAIRRAPGD
jgi:serine protease